MYFSFLWPMLALAAVAAAITFGVKLLRNRARSRRRVARRLGYPMIDLRRAAR